MTTVDSWPKTLPMPSVGSWNSTTETHLSSIFMTPKNEICSLRYVGVVLSWSCHALVLLVQNSQDQELSVDVMFVSLLWMVLSEYWKQRERKFRFFGHENELSISTVCLQQSDVKTYFKMRPGILIHCVKGWLPL